MALTPHVFDPKTDRIVAVTLDPNTITSIDPDEVHEWRIAIYDLVETNKFHPARVTSRGPYALHVSIVANYIVLDVRNPDTYEPIAAHYLSLTPFRRLIRDYFRIRESYYEAIKSASSFQIEAVDMGRRGVHNEANLRLVVNDEYGCVCSGWMHDHVADSSRTGQFRLRQSLPSHTTLHQRPALPGRMCAPLPRIACAGSLRRSCL